MVSKFLFCPQKSTFALLLAFFFMTPARAQEPVLKGSALFGSLRARQIGPAVMSGRVADIDGVAKNPKILYVGSAGGGLWKTTNGGVTFEPVFDKHTQSIGKVTVDQAHPDTVWVGTGEPWVRNSVSVGTGIYKTTDGGKNWRNLGLENTERISDIIVHPTNSNLVYVGTLGGLWHSNPDRGVFRTADGGKTWEKILFVDDKTGCADLAIDPTNPEVLYAAMWEFRRQPWNFHSGGPGSELYKTTDGGKNWQKVRAISTGLPTGTLGRIAVEVAPTNPKLVYATVEAEKKEDKGLYKSTDAGATWKRVSQSGGTTDRPFYYSRLVVDPLADSLVYKMATNPIVSKDGGKTFRAIRSGVHSDAHALWINPKNPEMMFLGTDGGVYRSFDRGTYWEHLKNLPLSQFYHVSVDNETPYHVYGGLQDNGSWMGPSRSPNGIENRDWQNVSGGDGFWVFRHPVNKDYIYCEYQGGNLLRYSLSTLQTKDIRPFPGPKDPKFRFNWNTPIHLSQLEPLRLYLGGQFLFRSENFGESWQIISPDLTTNDPAKQQQLKSGGLTIDNSSAENHCTIYAIAESPLSGQTIWVGTDDGNVQRTTDGGKAWTNLTANLWAAGVPKNTWVSHVEASYFDPNVAFISLDGHATGDFKPYVYKTTDGGQTWASLATADLKGYAHVVRQDPKNPDLLFVGTEFGLFISVDGGQNWSQFTNELPNVAVRDLVVHPTQDDLVLATHGRGIMVIDDLTPIRQLTKSVLAKDVAFLATKPVILRTLGGFQDFAGAGEFVGDNPSETAQITYYLKKRHTFGDMYLEVFDESGKLLKKLPAGKQPGINRVEWRTRLPAPKTATANSLAIGALFGPTLPEGKYTVRLTKGKDTLSTTLSLQADPQLPYSAADRKLQQQTVLRLYDLTEELAYTAEVVQSARKQADELSKQAKKLAKPLAAFAKEMEALNQKLVATSESGGITGEQQVREQLAEVYGGVSRFAGRPSQSQLDRTQTVEGIIKGYRQQAEALKTGKIAELNAQLKKAGLKEIAVKSWDEFKGNDK
jgi:photosystem II stability/assembly factor-like uncharacterized protein